MMMKLFFVFLFFSTVESSECRDCWIKDSAEDKCIPDPGLYSISCGTNQMTFKYENCVFGNNEAVSWIGACSSSGPVDNGTHTTVSVPLDDCAIDISSANDQITFSHRFGAEGTMVDGIFMQLNQYIPAQCSYPTTFDLNMSVYLYAPSPEEKDLSWIGPAQPEPKEDGEEVDTLLSEDSFVLGTPPVSSPPLIGSKYPFTIGFNAPLPKMGFSVEKCTISTNGTSGEMNLNFFVDGCAIKVLAMKTTSPWFLLGEVGEYAFNLFTLDRTASSQQLVCTLKLCYASDGENADEGTYCVSPPTQEYCEALDTYTRETIY